MKRVPTFGIDLGTTCSAIGLVENGAPRLIAVDGQDLLPSLVSYPEEGDPLVGHPALHRLVLSPETTIRSSKRFMGSDHRWLVREEFVSPVDVAVQILQRLCEAAKQEVGVAPSRVVITVPAWFTQAQRADTREAGRRAGLEVARIINEPTAAALAHAHGKELSQTALVYDLGGGTFDVSLVEQNGSLTEVRASCGDTHLGGDDIDEGLVSRVLDAVEQEDPALSQAISASLPALVKLRLAVEAAKIELSASLETRLRVPFVVEREDGPQHLDLPLFRDDVIAVAAPLIERTLGKVRQVLEDARVADKDVDALLLVGGSSRLPLVWESLRRKHGWEGSSAIPPDRAVALGAAIQAAILDGSRVDGILVDVAPFSLSVSAVEPQPGFEPDRMTCSVVTPRNSPLPSRHSERFSTTHPAQSCLRVNVFQGSHVNPLKNAILGRIVVDRLPPAPAGEPSRPIGVEFRHNLDGMVEIRIIDELTGRVEVGQLAADGEEFASLRREFEAELELSGCVPGDGIEEPVAGEPEGGIAAVHLASQGPLAGESSSGPTLTQSAEPKTTGEGVEVTADVDEARQTFASVFKEARALEEQHGEAAKELAELATRGQALLDEGEEQEALVVYDQLSDRLFELGIYL